MKASMKTERFFIGWEYPYKPSHRGRVYYMGTHIGNIRCDLDFGCWVFSRNAFALKVNLPVIPRAKSAKDILNSLEARFGKL